MSYVRQVSRMLDEEHRASLLLLGQFEQALARASRNAERDPELARQLGVLARNLDNELGRHFAFEENELFPRMQDAGDGDIAALLAGDHETIRAVAGELLPLACAAAAGTLDRAGWTALRPLALELVERLVAHIQKESMALLPLVEDLLDDDRDRELAFAYAAA